MFIVLVILFQWLAWQHYSLDGLDGIREAVRLVLYGGKPLLYFPYLLVQRLALLAQILLLLLHMPKAVAQVVDGYLMFVPHT